MKRLFYANVLSVLVLASFGAHAETYEMRVPSKGVKSPTRSLEARNNGSNTVISALAFGSVTQGNSSAAQTIKLVNTGNGKVKFTSPALSVPAPYSLSSNTCSGQLAKGASCTASVTFAPTDVGSYAAGMALTVNSNAQQPVSLSLSGTGTSAQPVTAFNWGFQWSAPAGTSLSGTAYADIGRTGNDTWAVEGSGGAGVKAQPYFTFTTPASGSAMAITWWARGVSGNSWVSKLVTGQGANGPVVHTAGFGGAWQQYTVGNLVPGTTYSVVVEVMDGSARLDDVSLVYTP
jgi:hypothetical protein